MLTVPTSGMVACDLRLMLTREQLQVLLLSRRDGLSHSEIARRRKTSKTAVSRLVMRAKDRLRSHGLGVPPVLIAARCMRQADFSRVADPTEFKPWESDNLN